MRATNVFLGIIALAAVVIAVEIRWSYPEAGIRVDRFTGAVERYSSDGEFQEVNGVQTRVTIGRWVPLHD